MTQQKQFYFCDTEKHTRQVFTEEENPRCSTCKAVMTYERFTDIMIEGLILKAGRHTLIDGKECFLNQGIVAR